MLARGDLAVEIPYYEVPFYEKILIQKARSLGKQIVIATQMLDSMIDNPKPTRAEVTDVYYATQSGADATMLSGESANGNFPVESVNVMANINREAEQNFDYLLAFETGLSYSVSSNSSMAYKIAKKTLTSDSSVIIAFSKNGKLIEALSSLRPNGVIMAMLGEKDMVSKFGCHYGVYAKYEPNAKIYDDNKKIKALAKEMGIFGNVIVANKNEFKVVKV